MIERVRRITDVPGGILFGNRNEGQRGKNSATILPDELTADRDDAGAEADTHEELSPATSRGVLKDG